MDNNDTLPTPVPPQKNSVFTKVKRPSWLKKGPLTKQEKIRFAIVVAAIVLLGGAVLYVVATQVAPSAEIFPGVTKQAEKKYYSPLNGVQVADEAATKRAVTAVMIENSPDARPQSGLAEADVVFEAVAEGGITRFIALYQPSQPGLVGPVRSLRPYYAQWAAGFDPSVAHVGGSPDALAMIRSGNYGVDIDQFFNPDSYWRAGDRAAPHNVYTNFERLNQLNESKNKKESSFTFSPRVDEKKVAEPNATAINIPVSSGIFAVDYSYNATTNTYERKQGGEAHLDREKGQIAPKVVVVIKTDISLSDDGSHMNIAVKSTGPAYIFQNGTVIEGTWGKSDEKATLVLRDANGKDIPLVRGQTWITVIGNDKNVTWQ
jgi:hypothetical protein